MAKQRGVTGHRPPAFPSKATLAAELDICESTVDALVARGVLPKPFKDGSFVRWNWAQVEASLAAAEASPDADPFMRGVSNVG